MVRVPSANTIQGLSSVDGTAYSLPANSSRLMNAVISMPYGATQEGPSFCGEQLEPEPEFVLPPNQYRYGKAQGEDQIDVEEGERLPPNRSKIAQGDSQDAGPQ